MCHFFDLISSSSFAKDCVKCARETNFYLMQMLTLCIISEKFEKKKKRKTRKIYKKKKKNRSKGHRWKSLDSMGRIVRISVHEMYFLYENKLFLQMSFNLSSRELYFERFIQIYSQISLDSKSNSKRSWCYFLILSCSILRIRYTSHTWYFNSATIESIKR